MNMVKNEIVLWYPYSNARCGGKTYLGNARLKTFFLVWTPSLIYKNMHKNHCVQFEISPRTGVMVTNIMHTKDSNMSGQF